MSEVRVFDSKELDFSFRGSPPISTYMPER